MTGAESVGSVFGICAVILAIVLGFLLILLPVFVLGIYSQIQLTNRLIKQLIKLYGHDPEK